MSPRAIKKKSSHVTLSPQATMTQSTSMIMKQNKMNHLQGSAWSYHSLPGLPALFHSSLPCRSRKMTLQVQENDPTPKPSTCQALSPACAHAVPTEKALTPGFPEPSGPSSLQVRPRACLPGQQQDRWPPHSTRVYLFFSPLGSGRVSHNLHVSCAQMCCV